MCFHLNVNCIRFNYKLIRLLIITFRAVIVQHLEKEVRARGLTQV